MLQEPRIWVDPLRRTTSGIFHVHVSGVAADSTLIAILESPGCEKLKLPIAVDSNGFGEASVFLHSNFGEYKASFESGYEADAARFWLGEIGTIGTPTSLSLIASKSRGQVGDIVQLWTEGDFISVITPSGVTNKLEVEFGTVFFTLAELGNYMMVAFSETGQIGSSGVVKLETVVSPPTGTEPQPPINCRGAVTVTPSFTDTSVASGQQTMLRLTVRNGTSSVQTVSLPALTLPAGMVAASPISLTNEVIAGNSARSFYFNVTVSGNETAEKQVLVPSNSGTYTCLGSQYYLLGGTASVRVEAPAAVCSLEAIFLTCTPTTIAPNGTTKLTYRVQNTGTERITNLRMMDTPTPPGCTPAVLSFAGVVLEPGMAFTYERDIVVANTSGIAKDVLFEIGANRVSGNCGSGTIYNPIAKSALVTATA